MKLENRKVGFLAVGEACEADLLHALKETFASCGLSAEETFISASMLPDCTATESDGVIKRESACFF